MNPRIGQHLGSLLPTSWRPGAAAWLAALRLAGGAQGRVVGGGCGLGQPGIRGEGMTMGSRCGELIRGLVAAFLLLGGSAGLAAERPSEYEVKAAFLYKFAYYVEWPQEAFPTDDAPLVIGVLGRDPFGSLLDQLVENKTIGKRPLQLKRFDQRDSIATCHVLFISTSEKRRLAAILEEVAPRGVLTVSELDWFAQSGGIIQMGVEAERVGLEINVEAAQRAGVKISSRLLKLAKITAGTEKR